MAAADMDGRARFGFWDEMVNKKPHRNWQYIGGGREEVKVKMSMG
jgi:hypothetical protein